MKINEALDWILQQGSRKDRFSLDPIKYILEELDNPQRDYTSVLVGGTNGKGSVVAITESILSADAEYNVATFTSPHILDVRERIKFNSQKVPDKLWIQATQALQPIYKILRKESSIGSAAFFETVTAIALWIYREMLCDLALLEVGLGGRFDATNATSPEISVITNIGTDHQQYLGTGKESIAREKVQIARKKRHLITSEKDETILEILKQESKKIGTTFVHASQHKYFEALESTIEGHLIRLPDIDPEPFFMPLAGIHQLENLQTSLCLIDRLKQNGFIVSDKAIKEGIMNVKWPGRLEWLSQKPPVLIDSAHNTEGVDSLIAYITEFYPKTSLNIIYGGLTDKPTATIADKIFAISDNLCYVPPNTPRALTKDDYLEHLGQNAQSWKWYNNIASALDSCVSNEKLTIIMGSIYLIAEAYAYFDKDK